MRPQLGKIDVTFVDGLWGYESYREGSGLSEDSGDLELGDDEPTNENLLLALGVGLANPLSRGCEAHLFNPDLSTRAIYAWRGCWISLCMGDCGMPHVPDVEGWERRV